MLERSSPSGSQREKDVSQCEVSQQKQCIKIAETGSARVSGYSKVTTRSYPSQEKEQWSVSLHLLCTSR